MERIETYRNKEEGQKTSQSPQKRPLVSTTDFQDAINENQSVRLFRFADEICSKAGREASGEGRGTCCAVLCCVWSLSRVRLFGTSRTAACQPPLSIKILQKRILEWVAMASSRGSSQPRDQPQVSRTARKFFII